MTGMMGKLRTMAGARGEGVLGVARDGGVVGVVHDGGDSNRGEMRTVTRVRVGSRPRVVGYSPLGPIWRPAPAVAP